MSNSSVLLVGLFFNKIFSNLRSRWTMSLRTKWWWGGKRTWIYPFYEDSTRHRSISPWCVWWWVRAMDRFSSRSHPILPLRTGRWPNTNSSKKKNRLFTFGEKHFAFSFTCDVSKTSCSWIKFGWLTSVKSFTSLSKNKALEGFPGWKMFSG